MEWLLILAVGCIIELILFILAKKRKKLEDSLPLSSDDFLDLLEKAESVEEDTTVIAGPPQHTIYEYSYLSAKCNCTMCDAENEGSSEVCIVCGAKLIQKGVY